MLKGKSIDEIINRWSTELETHVRDFNKFATEVAAWDRSLIENGNNVSHKCQTCLGRTLHDAVS
jgi:nuclear pore complex protein Nup62